MIVDCLRFDCTIICDISVGKSIIIKIVTSTLVDNFDCDGLVC